MTKIKLILIRSHAEFVGVRRKVAARILEMHGYKRGLWHFEYLTVKSSIRRRKNIRGVEMLG